MNIPSGSVTFLFTDIEGSTRLAQEFPESLPFALEKHHVIMHKVIESNNGFVFEIVGDAFCCAFENAEDAIKAAVDAQINLANEKWDDVKIRIRIGIHSGNAEWNGKRYMGYITLARTARVMSSAYGEQIIISNDAYEIAKGKIPNKISFRDLGERRLKDLKQPVKLFQILSEGLREDFPPLKTLDARPNNLPVQLTSFIGREAEMKTVKDLLKQTHLLTLTGSGGAGKTRLALQVAADVIDDFANGVWFVELASLSEQAFLPQAIMKVFDIKEEPKRNLEDTLFDYLKDKEMLIILDNCEHLIEPCSRLTEKLLSISPKLKIIATSREALRCEGEQTHRVLSLEVPDPKDEDTPEKLSQFEAVRLFIERALAIDSTFRVNNNNAPALAEICFQLDGIPLAIELAAARTKVLSVEQIYERLNDRFNLLTGGKRTALPRQQTLRALIDWSYDLLSEKEKILWRRLSVFAGGWTMEAAEEVCSDEILAKEKILDLLNQLTEKSIIIFEKNMERYRILETLKQYGEEKFIRANEVENFSSKHLHYFMKLSEIAEPKLIGTDQRMWLDRLDANQSNFQSAIEWSITVSIENGIRLAVALGRFWSLRGHYSIGSQLMEKIVEKSLVPNQYSFGKLLHWAGQLNGKIGDYDKAMKFFEESLSISLDSNNNEAVANSLEGMSVIARYQGNYDLAQKFGEEALALFRSIGNRYSLSSILTVMGVLENSWGNYKQAKNYIEEAMALSIESQDMLAIADRNLNLGDVETNLLNYHKAHKLYEKSLELFKELGNKSGMANSLGSLGNLEADSGNFDHALYLIEESVCLFRELGSKREIAISLHNTGEIALHQKNWKKAQKDNEESLELFKQIGDKKGISYSLHYIGIVAFKTKNYTRSQELCEKSLRLGLEIGHGVTVALNLLAFAGIFCVASNFSVSVLLLASVETFHKSIGEVLNSIHNKLKQKIITKLHQQLSEEEFSKYWEQGIQLTLEKASELTLSSIK